MAKMRIVSANIVGFYSYKPDIEINYYGECQEVSKECVICKRQLYEPSYDTMSDNKNIFRETEILIGKCGHLFHGDCMCKWLENSTDCPIDKQKWCLHRIADTTTRLELDKYPNKSFNKFDKSNKFNKFDTSLIKNKFNQARKYVKNIQA
jgi:hypothetical protein